MATTFATNHIRQIGVGIAKAIKHGRNRNKTDNARLLKHLAMLIFFVVGAVVGTVMCNIFSGKAIWGTLVLLIIVFVALLHADLTTEKNMMDKKPGGH